MSLNILMQKWETELQKDSSYNGFFISDGIVNADIYNKSDKKILFLLLEPYNKELDSNYTSLTKYLVEGSHGRSTTWQNGSKIIAKFENKDLKWCNLYAREIVKNKLAESFSDFKKIQLNKIAVLNIKKEANIKGTRADLNLIKQHAEKFAPLIAEEIKLIEPDIIYCGGLNYKKIFLTALANYLPKGSEWPPSKDGRAFSEIIYNGVRIINSYHPTRTGQIRSIFDLL